MVMLTKSLASSVRSKVSCSVSRTVAMIIWELFFLLLSSLFFFCFRPFSVWCDRALVDASVMYIDLSYRSQFGSFLVVVFFRELINSYLF